MKKHILIFSLILISQSAFAQHNPAPLKQTGMFSLGMRSTWGLFNGESLSNSSLGSGGQFRIQLARQINTEWYLDYMSALQFDQVNRKDLHIGWSVFFYPLVKADAPPGLLQPFLEAGHCFDYTRLSANEFTTTAERWSSAVQMGLGTHVNLSPRFDVTLKGQYMLHLGTDIHAHVEDNLVSFESHKGAGAEGHTLITLSVNYKLFNLW